MEARKEKSETSTDVSVVNSNMWCNLFQHQQRQNVQNGKKRDEMHLCSIGGKRVYKVCMSIVKIDICPENSEYSFATEKLEIQHQ